MLALLGAANSIQFTCMNTLTLIDLPNADASSGNSLLSTIMQLSIAVSIAAASLLLDSFGGHSATSGKAVEAAFHAAFVTIGAIAAASSFIFALVVGSRQVHLAHHPAAEHFPRSDWCPQASVPRAGRECVPPEAGYGGMYFP